MSTGRIKALQKNVYSIKGYQIEEITRKYAHGTTILLCNGHNAFKGNLQTFLMDKKTE